MCTRPPRNGRLTASLSLTHGRRKGGMPTEVAFDGLHLLISDSDILNVAEGFAVFGPAEVFHKCLVALSEKLLDFEVVDEVDLRFPTALLEGAFADVIVIVRAGKSEVLGQ